MLAAVGIAVCAGVVVAVWVAGALYNALHRLRIAPAHARRERILGASPGRRACPHRRGSGVCGPGGCRPQLFCRPGRGGLVGPGPRARRAGR